jgi:hypothetical protein
MIAFLIRPSPLSTPVPRPYEEMAAEANAAARSAVTKSQTLAAVWSKPLGRARLILNQIGRRLTESLKSNGNRHRLLLMLDEFPALGSSISSRARWPSWRVMA